MVDSRVTYEKRLSDNLNILFGAGRWHDTKELLDVSAVRAGWGCRVLDQESWENLITQSVPEKIFISLHMDNEGLLSTISFGSY